MGISNALSVDQQLACIWGKRNLRLKKTVCSIPAQSVLTDLLVNYRPNARYAGMQRNFPEPAVLIRLGENVAVVRRIEVLSVPVVAVDSEILEVVVPLVKPQFTTEQSGSPTRTDNETASDAIFRSAVKIPDSGYSISIEGYS